MNADEALTSAKGSFSFFGGTKLMLNVGGGLSLGQPGISGFLAFTNEAPQDSRVVAHSSPHSQR